MKYEYEYTKPYSQSLSNENDPQSREVAKKFFKKHKKMILKDNPEEKAVDLIAEDGSSWELEHRNVWKTKKFPYSDVNIMYRKKYLAYGKTHYVIFSEDFSVVGIIKPEIVAPYIITENLHRSFNKTVSGGREYVFKVPTDKFEFFDVKSGKKI